jgi:nucleotide-binding universal stress UspA family protein
MRPRPDGYGTLVARAWGYRQLEEEGMRGTLVCAVTDTDEGRGALEAAVELSERLGVRLVLAHVAEGIAPIDGNGDRPESVTTGNREDAARVLARLAAEYGVADTAERRSSVGDPAALLGQIAAEEAADLIVVGARLRGRLRRRLESRLADALDSETSVPILIAPPRRENARMNGGRR